MSIGQCGCLHMTEHKGTSFAHSCMKMPVDPYSRHPSPLYERPKCTRTKEMSIGKSPLFQRERASDKPRTNIDTKKSMELSSACEDYNSLLEFIQSIPDYTEVHHFSNEQFKQKIDYLKRKQRLLLKNLRNCLEQEENKDNRAKRMSTIYTDEYLDSKLPRPKSSFGSKNVVNTELALKGKRCNLEESRTNSPLLFPASSFSCLIEDQDLLTHRCKDYKKAEKTRRNEEILSASKAWSSGSESKNIESPESDDQEVAIETKSLPAQSPKRWQPTVPKPFSFTLREDSEKYMTMIEKQAHEEIINSRRNKKNRAKKRRLRSVPLTSKIPLYDKLMADKEERSRAVRQESVLNLLSQVRPFKLECERRALRTLTRSSPELSEKGRDCTSSKFTARPIPKNLFSSEVCHRMLEDEYFRNVQKRIRAMELMRSSSLPPSMARRNRCRSALSSRSQNPIKSSSEERTRSSAECDLSSLGLDCSTPMHSERCRSAAMMTLPPHSNNLAAILRAQVSREKLERETREQLEEKRRDQLVRLRKALIGRKPAWRALRSAARHEHERDLDLRTSLRRGEMREQAERHRLQMEMMNDRVTRIPTLFERYSQDEMMLQSFQSSMRLYPKFQELPKLGLETNKKKKKKSNWKGQSPSSGDSYASLTSSWHRNSSSLSSSPGTPPSLRYTCASGNSRRSTEKKKYDRGPLRVSINETAELIEDRNYDDDDSAEDTNQTYVNNEKLRLDSDTKITEKDRFLLAKEELFSL